METNADILFSEIVNIHLLIIFVDNALIIRKQ